MQMHLLPCSLPAPADFEFFNSTLHILHPCPHQHCYFWYMVITSQALWRSNLSGYLSTITKTGHFYSHFTDGDSDTGQIQMTGS